MSNVTIASYNGCGKTVTEPLYQYDYGQILQLSGFELPEAYEVHFAPVGRLQSITQIGSPDGVSIPDECLKSGEPINAWLFLHTAADDGETVYKIVIPVIRRAMPSDVEPTPEQQDVITEAIAALNAGVSRVETAAESAEIFANDAAESSASASVSEERAQEYAQQAEATAAAVASELEEARADYLKMFPTDTTNGDPASFPDGADDIPVKALTAQINATQELNGYDHPWAGGAGKNKFPLLLDDGATGGITFTKTLDASGNVIGVRYSGTRAAGSTNLHKILGVTYLEAGTYRVSGGFGTAAVGGILNVRLSDSMTQVGPAPVAQDTGSGATWTVAEANWYQITLGINAGVTVDAEIHPMICLASESDQTFAPYENICPISGRTAVTVSVSANADMSGAADVTVQLGQTVYGGNLETASGLLTVTHAEIASYNGETIAEPWISDRDVYVAGTQPSIGAQVVYPMATPITAQLTPTEIDTLLGQNYIEADTGAVGVTYRADVGLYIDKKIAAVTA